MMTHVRHSAAIQGIGVWRGGGLKICKMENRKSDSWLNSLSFCPCCNYAEEKSSIESMRFDLDCPRCGGAKLSQYYSVGSDTHHKQLEEWKNGRRTTLKQGSGQSILILMPPALSDKN